MDEIVAPALLGDLKLVGCLSQPFEFASGAPIGNASDGSGGGAAVDPPAA